MSLAISAENAVGSTQPGQSGPLQEASERSLSPGKTFSEMLELAGRAIDRSGLGLHTEIQAIEQRIKSGPVLSPQELISYQIKAGRFGLSVEMVSKLAEGMMATMRKFQQGQ